jgi:hypothetical protein
VSQMALGSLLAPLSIWQLRGKNGFNPCMRFGCLANNSDIRLTMLGKSILGSHYVNMKCDNDVGMIS